jgi:hypothetical protein
MKDNKHIKSFNQHGVNEGYTDEKVSEIGQKYEEFKKYIKNLDYDDLMEYAELSQEFKILDILEFLKEKS